MVGSVKLKPNGRPRITSSVLERRRLAKITKPRQARRDSLSETQYLSEGSTSSTSEEEEDVSYSTHISRLGKFLNKALLILPLSITMFIRSLASREFRAVVLAWSIILPLTSDISMDEGVFPALVASSLGCENAVVARNMYLSIARSRLGLAVLALLSLYTDNWDILLGGVLLRILVSFASFLLQNSIPKSEITLISGAVVNALYHIRLVSPNNVYDPSIIVTCGLAGALPCYPLFVRFAKVYRNSKGQNTKSLWRLAVSIYILYLGVAGSLYFGIFVPNVRELWLAIVHNRDLLFYWMVILGCAFAVAFFLGSKIGLDGRRKLWHICAVAMFNPKWVRDRPFTELALAATLVLFIALETARATALPPFGIKLHNALKTYTDHRDHRGPVIISHIYLLLGISVPIFLAKSSAGVVCLGIGDTLASQVGRRFGQYRIFGHKSVEGCFAFALGAGLALYFASSTGYDWLIIIPTALLEAVTTLNDNLVVPMYMLALQSLVSGFQHLN